MIVEIITISYIIGIGCTYQSYKEDLTTSGLYPLLFFILSPLLILIKLGMMIADYEP